MPNVARHTTSAVFPAYRSPQRRTDTSGIVDGCGNIRTVTSAGEPAIEVGVWTVDSDTLAAVSNEHQPDRRLIVLDTAGVVDRAGFFAAVRAQLPQDPPLGSYRDVWDAMADSLFGGLDAIEAFAVTVIWTGSETFRQAAPGEYATALEVLRDVTSQVADPEATDGRPTAVRVHRRLVRRGPS